MTPVEKVAEVISKFDLDGASGFYEEELTKAAVAAIEALKDCVPIQQPWTKIRDVNSAYAIDRMKWRDLISALLSERK